MTAAIDNLIDQCLTPAEQRQILLLACRGKAADQLHAIDEAIASVTGRDPRRVARVARSDRAPRQLSVEPKAVDQVSIEPPQRKKRVISPEGRERIRQAAMKRWAKKKGDASAPAEASSTPAVIVQRSITPSPPSEPASELSPLPAANRETRPRFEQKSDAINAQRRAAEPDTPTSIDPFSNLSESLPKRRRRRPPAWVGSVADAEKREHVAS